MNVENVIYNEECVAGLRRIESASVDVVLTDPPYGYLEMQHWDVAFNEQAFFEEVKRILKPDGFIVMFGRGTSFYRWNTRLAELGFKFKEEIVWDKRYTSSPAQQLHRVHETISLYTKKSGVIRKHWLPYKEVVSNNIDKVLGDIARLKSMVDNGRFFDALAEVLRTEKEGEKRVYDIPSAPTSNINLERKDFLWEESHDVQLIRHLRRGGLEKSIIPIPNLRLKEKKIHPTQKPVRLLERLLAVVSEPGALVVDPFSGSASTAVACLRTGRRYIGYEIDKTFYERSLERLKAEQEQLAAAAKGAQGKKEQEEQLCLVNE